MRGSLLWVFASVALCAPLEAANQKALGFAFSDAGSDLPVLKLDYGTFQATAYDKDHDNIRFAAPPVGELRWAKPAPPVLNTTVQDGSYGPTCVQGGSMFGASDDPNEMSGDEDCLFLDLYMPGKAVRGEADQIPVVVWIYGGAYVLGSKEMFSDGLPIVKAAKGNAIYVAGNYRLGPFGFLGGTTVENQGVPNTGFWDQHAVFQWVQKYASNLKANPKRVSAWGESAGAGSIFHHLVFEGGKRDPLFTSAVAESPAFASAQDRCGSMEDTYKALAKEAGCSGKGLSCLRGLTTKEIFAASNVLSQRQRPGSFAFGPGPDGTLIRQLAQLEFADGNYFKGLESLISQHVKDESSQFVDPSVRTFSDFSAYLVQTFGNSSDAATTISEIKSLYTPPGVSSTASAHKQVNEYVRDSSFTCNNRILATAYPGKTWSSKYSAAPGIHGSDITATFYDPDAASPAIDKKAEAWRLGYQSYLASLIQTGDPNKLRDQQATIEWPLTTGTESEKLKGVLEIKGGLGTAAFDLIDDDQNLKARCDLWHNVNTRIKAALTCSK